MFRGFLRLFFIPTVVMPSPAAASPLTPGNPVIYRAGNGTNRLTAEGSPVFADENTPAGTLVRSLSMPTAVSMDHRIGVISEEAHDFRGPGSDQMWRCVPNGPISGCSGD